MKVENKKLNVPAARYLLHTTPYTTVAIPC
jgi:hypothetical protein